jgi:hypothetical protein
MNSVVVREPTFTMPNSENHDCWEDDRKTIAGLSQEHGDGHEKNANLEVTPGEMGPDPGPSHQNEQPGLHRRPRARQRLKQNHRPKLPENHLTSSFIGHGKI